MNKPISKQLMDLYMLDIAECTHTNDHTEARCQGASLIGAYDLKKSYDAVETLVSKFGYLTELASTARQALDKDLWSRAEKRLSPEQFTQFKGGY